MRITKILNNNVVEATDQTDSQVIVIGRGIGHEKKRGEEITIAAADEIFLMTNKKLFPTVQNLLVSVSTDLIETSNLIISYGKKQLAHSLNQNIIITLTDHLDYAIKRARDGFTISNPLNWDIKRFYPKEYQIGIYALKLVKRYQFTKLPEDEAGFIAMHFVDAALEGGQSHNIMRLTQVIKAVLDIVAANVANIDYQSLSYSRFIRHIQYMAIRIIDHKVTADHVDQEITTLVFKKYPAELKLAEKIKQQLQAQFTVTINDAELTYMTLHLARLIGREGE